VRSRLVRAMLVYLGGNQAAELLRQQQVLREQIVKLMELQQPQGGIPPTEVTQARIALRSTRLDVLETQRQAAEARVQLAEAIGVPVAALEDVSMDLPLTEDLPEAVRSVEARRRALTGRADVLSPLRGWFLEKARVARHEYPTLARGATRRRPLRGLRIPSADSATDPSRCPGCCD
jgi:outer membrane protein TolC